MTAGTVTLRSFETLADYEACVELQRDTWGRDYSGCVPAPLLMVAHKVGGVIAGAFDADGRLLGFVFGITGYCDGRPLHWSHMLAVRPSAQGAGLGLRLKLYQRELLVERGVEIARWTFDPLVAKNAHLNLNRLGAVVIEYVENMYGESNSALHAGLGTDRFVVEWRLADPRVQSLIAGVADPGAAAVPPPLPVRVEIPQDIHAVRRRSTLQAAEWRTRTRRAFLEYLAQGYVIAGFHRDLAGGRCFYGLTPASHAA